MVFFLLSLGEKIRETENQEENISLVLYFFYPPNLRGKWEEKDVE